MLRTDRCDHCGIPEQRLGDLRPCHGYLVCPTCMRDAQLEIKKRRQEDDRVLREIREAGLRERMRT